MEHWSKMGKNKTLCAISYHLCNLKNVKEQDKAEKDSSQITIRKFPIGEKNGCMWKKDAVDKRQDMLN